MKANEIKDMTVDELNSKLAELKQELFNLRFQHAVNQRSPVEATNPCFHQTK